MVVLMPTGHHEIILKLSLGFIQATTYAAVLEFWDMTCF